MKHPPYHLRINKAVDRFLLVEMLNILRRRLDISNYTYYGFGGPFLEDCRLLREYCSDLDLVSIERDAETYKRQKFHRFTKNKLRLVDKNLNSFLAADFVGTGKEIFWLDYVDSKYERFEEFKMVLQKVGDNSLVKITLRATFFGNTFRERDLDNDSVITPDQKTFINNFNRRYRNVLPTRIEDKEIFARPLKTIELICRMLRIAASKALPYEGGSVFQPLNASHYQDGVPMLSVMGIVCPHEEVEGIKELFRDWPFANLSWETPHKIDVPVLSTKERFHIEDLLPTETHDGTDLARALGYNIDDDAVTSIEKLCQYEYFHQYYPHFIRAYL